MVPLQEEWGDTPLTAACIRGHVTTAALLIEKKASVGYISKVRYIVYVILHPQYKFTFLRLLGNYVVIMM